MWELAWGLKNLDIDVEMITCDCPGRIVYVDEHQVAAVPHRGSNPQLRRLLN